MSAKGEGRSQVYAQIVGDVVEVHSSEKTGLTISFDKKPTLVSNRATLSLAAIHFVVIDIKEGRSCP